MNYLLMLTIGFIGFVGCKPPGAEDDASKSKAIGNLGQEGAASISAECGFNFDEASEKMRSSLSARKAFVDSLYANGKVEVSAQSKSKLTRALLAVPNMLLKDFFDLGKGKIVVSVEKAANQCSESPFGCLGGTRAQNEANLGTPTIYLADSHVSGLIPHLTKALFDYVYKVSYQAALDREESAEDLGLTEVSDDEDSSTDSKRASPEGTGSLSAVALNSLLQIPFQLVDAFKADVAAMPDGEEKSQFLAFLERNKLQEANLASELMAHATDSRYCSQKTGAVFADGGKFPKTGAAYIGALNGFFGVPFYEIK